MIEWRAVRNAGDLHAELNEWDNTVHDLECANVDLGHNVIVKYTSLARMVSHLLQQSDYHVHLTMPVAWVEMMTPGNSDQLRQVIETCACVYASLAKSTDGEAYSVDLSNEICYSHREGECKLGTDCTRKHLRSGNNQDSDASSTDQNQSQE